MKRTALTLTLLLTLSVSMLAGISLPLKVIAEAPLLEWERTFSQTPGVANDLIQTSDGGYAVACTEDHFNSLTAGAAALIKTDSMGNLQWKRNYEAPSGTYTDCNVSQTLNGGYTIEGTPGISASEATSVIQTADGGYVLAGFEGWMVTFNWTHGISGKGGWSVYFLIRTDSEGKQMWKKTYEYASLNYLGGNLSEPAWTNLQAKLSTTIQTSDEGYALAGSLDFRLGWIVKTDSQGNAQWNQTIEPVRSTESGDRLDFIEQTSDGGYVLGGSLGEPLFLRIDQYGNVISRVDFAEISFSFFNIFQCIKGNDGGYLWLTYRQALKINPYGILQWDESYPSTRLLVSGIQTPDGGYLLVQVANFFEHIDDPNSVVKTHLVKIDASGDFEWSKPYGAPLDSATQITATSDGGYAVTGSRLGDAQSEGRYGWSASKQWVMLMKIAPQANLAPPETLGTISILSPKNQTYFTSSLPLAYSIGGNASWVGYSLNSTTPVSLVQNTTLEGLKDGTHTLVIYATDIEETTVASETLYFTINANSFNISILSPEKDRTYNVADVPLRFRVDTQLALMRYSLDGQANVTINGNTTLTGLIDGNHNIVIYGNDTFGNVVASETVQFSVLVLLSTTPQFPTFQVVTAVIITVAVGTGLLLYFRRHKKVEANK